MKHVEKTKNKKDLFLMYCAKRETMSSAVKKQKQLAKNNKIFKNTHTSSTLKTLASWLILNCFVIFFSVKSFSLQNTIQFKKAISITHKYIQYFAEKFVFYYRGTSEPFFRVDLLFFKYYCFFLSFLMRTPFNGTPNKYCTTLKTQPNVNVFVLLECYQ